MASILFGLLSACSWGAGDYTGGLVSRKIGSARATLYAEIAGLLPLLIAAFLAGEPGLSIPDILWCAAGGMLGSLGLVGLYKAFSDGQMSIAAPVAGLTSAAIPVVFGAVTGGIPPLPTIAGFVLALVAIALITQSHSSAHQKPVTLNTLLVPLLAGISFGCYFILIHQGSRNTLFWPSVVARSAGAMTILCYAAFTRQLALPTRSVLPLVFVMAVFDVGGNLFYLLAGQAGRMDVAVVLSSLYSGVTVFLGWMFLREKITSTQFAGILAALGAIALMTL